MNVSRYWQMQGTQAAKEKQIDVQTAKKRAKQMHDLHLQLALENNKKYLQNHDKAKALIDDKIGKSYLARDDNYKLIIINQPTNLGKFVRINLKKAYPHYIIGEIV